MVAERGSEPLAVPVRVGYACPQSRLQWLVACSAEDSTNRLRRGDENVSGARTSHHYPRAWTARAGIAGGWSFTKLSKANQSRSQPGTISNMSPLSKIRHTPRPARLS